MSIKDLFKAKSKQDDLPPKSSVADSEGQGGVHDANQQLDLDSQSSQQSVNDAENSTEPTTHQDVTQSESPPQETSSVPNDPVPPTTPTPMPEILGVLENLVQQVGKIEATLQGFSYKERITKELHEELQKYKNGLRKELTTPLLKHIMLLHGRLMDMYDYYANNTSQDTEAFQNLLMEYKQLPDHLTVLLHDYEIESLESKEGDSYQPQKHEATKTIFTDNPNKDRIIASCERVGFFDVSNGYVLKRAKVTIFRLNPASVGNQTNSTNESQTP